MTQEFYENPFTAHELQHLACGQGEAIIENGEIVGTVRPLAEEGDFCLYVLDDELLSSVFDFVKEQKDFNKVLSLDYQLEDLGYELEEHPVFRGGVYES